MRNLVIFSILLAGVFSLSIPHFNGDPATIDPYIFEDIINETLESLRPDIPDPLTIDSLALDFPNSDDAIVTGNASISNFRLSGLQGFQVQALNLAVIGVTLNFTVEFPVIELYTDYSLDLNIGDTFYLYGDGNVTVRFEDLVIQASGHANLTNGISISNLLVQIYLGNATFDIHGLLNDEEVSDLLSSILNDIFVRFIDENPELVTQIASPIIQNIINAILGVILAPTTTAPPTETTPSFVLT